MAELTPEQCFEAFANQRGRPALFLFHGSGPLARDHVLALHDELGDQQLEEVDLVLHSGGGDAHAAYQLISLVRNHAERVNACVPFFAKSAATLLCIGADKIVLGEHAELGPLDVQVWEEKKPGQGEFHSALDPFKALEQLQALSAEALTSAMRVIVSNYGMSYDDCLRHAIAFVQVTTGPLIGLLDPEKLGQYSRELSVATEYGQRLLRRCSSWSDDEINRVIEQLVYGYPSHEYIIDYPELKDLGFNVELFPAEDRSVVAGLRPMILARQASNVIKLVIPEVEEADEEAPDAQKLVQLNKEATTLGEAEPDDEAEVS